MRQVEFSEYMEEISFHVGKFGNLVGEVPELHHTGWRIQQRSIWKSVCCSYSALPYVSLNAE